MIWGIDENWFLTDSFGNSFKTYFFCSLQMLFKGSWDVSRFFQKISSSLNKLVIEEENKTAVENSIFKKSATGTFWA